MKLYFNLEDASQITIGAFVLAVPISFSQEAWDLGNSLPIINLLLLFALSVFFLALFTLESLFQGKIQYRIPVFIFRIFIAYLLAGMVVSLILFTLNKFPILSDPSLAIKRLILITMPASMGAIIVDSIDKE